MIALADPLSKPLHGWLVLTLRPAGQARGLQARLRASGARTLNLPLLRLRPSSVATANRQLAAATADARWLFTSPAAAHFTAQVLPALFATGGAVDSAASTDRVFAPGPGTAQALASHGIAPTLIPAHRYDSEGVLALPALSPPLRGDLMLVGAAGGRDLLQSELSRRGLAVKPLHVYRRTAASIDGHRFETIITHPRLALIASSALMLARLHDASPAPALDHLHRRAALIVSSQRLAAQAQASGFAHCHVAGSPTDDGLATALLAHVAALPDATAPD